MTTMPVVPDAPETVDETWPMVTESVTHLFDELAAASGHVAIGPRLDELGWADIESEYPIAANALLFDAQGRTLASTDCLDRIMLAELRALVGGDVDAIVLPEPGEAYTPSSNDERITGIVLGPLRGRVAVPLRGPFLGAVSITVVDAAHLTGERMDTTGPESMVRRRGTSSTRPPSGTAPSPPRSAHWAPSSSHWLTAPCTSPSNRSARERNSGHRSGRCSRPAMRSRRPRPHWPGRGPCSTSRGGTAVCYPRSQARSRQAGPIGSSPTPHSRCAARSG